MRSNAIALPCVRPTTEGSNTAVIRGDRLFLKACRRVRPGINPELEMGRFLTEASPFPNVVPVASALEYHSADGTSFTPCPL